MPLPDSANESRIVSLRETRGQEPRTGRALKPFFGLSVAASLPHAGLLVWERTLLSAAVDPATPRVGERGHPPGLTRKNVEAN